MHTCLYMCDNFFEFPVRGDCNSEQKLTSCRTLYK
uniref:Uncharacterized protein n=1 Tax=Rhizophora mucronata TaxID=61149 RepID=A0A2P2NE24_RHIMU